MTEVLMLAIALIVWVAVAFDNRHIDWHDTED